MLIINFDSGFTFCLKTRRERVRIASSARAVCSVAWRVVVVAWWLWVDDTYRQGAMCLRCGTTAAEWQTAETDEISHYERAQCAVVYGYHTPLHVVVGNCGG